MERSFSKSTVFRRSKIIEELNINGQVFVQKLSRLFMISEVTIRNDLARLEKQNMGYPIVTREICNVLNVNKLQNEQFFRK